MIYWLVPLLLLVISAVVVIGLLVRKIPKLRVIDTESSLRSKARKVKEEIIRERLKRLRGPRLSKLIKKTQAASRGLSKLGRRSVQRLKALEKHYQELKEAPASAGQVSDPETIKRMMEEAAELTREGKFGSAEKRYVEIISHDSKNTRAYEELGRLYIKMKQPEQARETFNFILNFQPEDASVMVSLGEIALEERELKNALDYFEQAVELRPKNPKYLDFMIDTAIALEEVEPARRGIDQLTKVNPENKKLEEFEERIKGLSVTPAKKSLQKK